MNMDFITIFDIGVIALVLILGIKGIISGLIKEIFGLLGLIGGIVVASRFAKEAGEFISDKIYKIDGDSALFFVGFLSLLVGFWIACLAIGAFISKLAGMSGLGFLDRIGGFIVGISKIFLVFSVLVVVLSNIQIANNKLEPYFQGSKLYPILLETGKWIMNVDVNSIKKSIEEKIQVPTVTEKDNMIQIVDENKTMQIDDNKTQKE